jgi:hypothetical protein
VGVASGYSIKWVQFGVKRSGFIVLGHRILVALVGVDNFQNKRMTNDIGTVK